MRYWFTADTHFGFPAILGITKRLEYFRTTELHDQLIVGAINAWCASEDLLYVVGDFAGHINRDVMRFYQSQIRCRVELVHGNHDHPIMTVPSRTLRFEDETLFLNHYPHAYWPGSHRGVRHLYGHVHSFREETLDACFPGRRSMDVGLDNAYRLLGDYRPFSLEEVLQFTGGEGHDPVSFYEEARGA